MYKVFCDSVKILIISQVEFVNKEIDFGTEITLKDLIYKLNHAKLDTNYFVISSNLSKTISEFESNFRIKTAAGGWVFNSDNELLMIKRNGIWDIAKGHLEKNENIEECALREVEEETGVSGFSFISYLGISQHIYLEKGNWVLKQSHWFKMQTTFRGLLVPQKEEGIEEVIWVNPRKINYYLNHSWKSLEEFYLNIID